MNYIFTSCLSIHLFVPCINLQPKLETVLVGETHVSFCATAEIKPEALIGQGSNRRGGTCTPVIHTRTSTQFFSHPASPSALPCTKAHCPAPWLRCPGRFPGLVTHFPASSGLSAAQWRPQPGPAEQTVSCMPPDFPLSCPMVTTVKQIKEFPV